METRSKGGKGVSLGLLVLVVLMAVPIWATPVDLDIYDDTTISDGEYGTVNIYDTLPNQTTVDMAGGLIEYCNVYDNSIFNLTDGEICLVTMNNNSSAFVNIDDAITFKLYNDSQTYLYELGSHSSIFIYDDAELHIYGYNLNYDEAVSPNWVTGQWKNGQEFKLYLRNIISYDPAQVVLHEIPEPATICLFAFGTIFLKKNSK